MNEQLVAQLQRVTDDLDIRRVITDYASFITRDSGRHRLREVFADDFAVEYHNGRTRVEGPQAVVDYIIENTAHLAWQHHNVTPYGIDISGDEATAQVYLISHQVVTDEPEHVLTMVATYDLQLRRAGNSWQLTFMEHHIKVALRADPLTSHFSLGGAYVPPAVRHSPSRTIRRHLTRSASCKTTAPAPASRPRTPATRRTASSAPRRPGARSSTSTTPPRSRRWGDFSEFEELRAQGPTAYSTYGPGFWMLLTSAGCARRTRRRRSSAAAPPHPTVPHPDWQWIPTMIDPPLHGEYRRMMNIAFSPRFVRQIEDSVRQDCVEAIESFLDKGQCDFIEDFAKIYPTKVFLRIVGLPLEDTGFMGWVETIFEGLGHFGDEAEDQLQAQREIHKYFEGVLKDRRENPPANPEEDFFSIIASSQINGRPITNEEFLNMSEVLLLAGLDTIKSQLRDIFYHLAITPKDREWIVREPEIIPNAIEEFLRAHNIVMTARQVAQDTDFHGCPMKKGDMVMVANPSASRDEAEYDNPTEIQFDRQVNRHYSFAGPVCGGTPGATRDGHRHRGVAQAHSGIPRAEHRRPRC